MNVGVLIFVAVWGSLCYAEDKFVSIMKIGKDNAFGHDAAVWTSTEIANTEQSVKYPEFNTMPFRKIRACVATPTPSCLEHKFSRTMNNAIELFRGPHLAEGVNKDEFLKFFESSNSRCDPVQPGFNADCGEHVKARWGYCGARPELPCSSTGPGSPCEIEYNYDYWGNDITCIPQASIEACCLHCSVTPNCQSWTWVRPNRGCCIKHTLKVNRKPLGITDSGVPRRGAFTRIPLTSCNSNIDPKDCAMTWDDNLQTSYRAERTFTLTYTFQQMYQLAAVFVSIINARPNDVTVSIPGGPSQKFELNDPNQQVLILSAPVVTKTVEITMTINQAILPRHFIRLLRVANGIKEISFWAPAQRPEAAIGIGIRDATAQIGAGYTQHFNGGAKSFEVTLEVKPHYACHTNNGGCDGHKTCTDSDDGAVCGPCPEGFTEQEGKCNDVDECLATPSPCSPLVKCENTPGGFSCGACPSGYSGDGKTCTDINECETTPNGGCDPLTQCENTEGSRKCSECPAGYHGNGAQEGGCADVDECKETKPCDKLTECINNRGGYECGICPDGYKGHGSTGCEDIDECIHHEGLCDRETKCKNIPGGFDCTPCPRGFTGTGKQGCIDVDECKQMPNGGCDPLVECINTRGGRDCGPCPKGYNGKGDTGCHDINECESDHGNCDENVRCRNTMGSYECEECPVGWTGTGYTKCVEPESENPVGDSIDDITTRAAEEHSSNIVKKDKDEYLKKQIEDLQKKEEEEKKASVEKMKNDLDHLEKAADEELKAREEHLKEQAHLEELKLAEEAKIRQEAIKQRVHEIHQRVSDQQVLSP